MHRLSKLNFLFFLMLGHTIRRSFAVFGQTAGSMQHRDAAMFPQQNLRWTYRELEFYSRAYSHGLSEIGFKAGNNMALWISPKDAAESLVMQLACFRLGVDINSILNESDFNAVVEKANGIVFSPSEPLESNRNEKRVDLVIDTFPAMRKALPGTPVETHLTSIIHTGFFTIRGALKMKQIANFTAKPLADAAGAKFSGQDVGKKAGELMKDLGMAKADTLYNMTDFMQPGSFAGSLAGLMSQGRLVFPVQDSNPFDDIKAQETSTLMFDADNIVMPSDGDFALNNLVVIGKDQGAADKAAKELKDKASVSAKKVTFIQSS